MVVIANYTVVRSLYHNTLNFRQQKSSFYIFCNFAELKKYNNIVSTYSILHSHSTTEFTFGLVNISYTTQRPRMAIMILKGGAVHFMYVYDTLQERQSS